MNGLRKVTAGTLFAATLLSAFALAGPAQAGSNGRKNTTLVLGAVTANELLRGHTTNALIAGAATAYAYNKYKDEKRDEDRYDRRHRRFVDRLDDRRHDRDYDRHYDRDYDRDRDDHGRYGRDHRDRNVNIRYGAYDYRDLSVGNRNDRDRDHRSKDRHHG